jgi:hypothetical protein
MRALNVNFAPKRPWPAWAWVGASALLMAVAARQGSAAWHLRQQTQAIDAKVARLQAAQARAARAHADAEALARQPAPYAQDAAAEADTAAYPTEGVLAALESVQIGGIKVSAIEISPAEHTTRLQIEFTDQTALLHYLEALNDGSTLGRWSLIKVRPPSATEPVGHAQIAVSAR